MEGRHTQKAEYPHGDVSRLFVAILGKNLHKIYGTVEVLVAFACNSRESEDIYQRKRPTKVKIFDSGLAHLCQV